MLITDRRRVASLYNAPRTVRSAPEQAASGRSWEVGGPVGDRSQHGLGPNPAHGRVRPSRPRLTGPQRMMSMREALQKGNVAFGSTASFPTSIQVRFTPR